MKDSICQTTKNGDLYNILPKGDENVEVQSGPKDSTGHEDTHSTIKEGNKLNIS